MVTKLLSGVAIVAMIAVGCSSESPTGSDNMSAEELGALNNNDNAFGDEAELSAAKFGRWHGCDPEDMTTFTVTVENVSDGMTLHLSNGETAPAPHSPGVWAITRLFNPLFGVNRFDRGLGLEEQAEDGNPMILAGNMEGRRGVKSSGVFLIPVGDSEPGPATPGKKFQFTVTACPGDRLSFTSMFGQSNDLFYAPGRFGVPLFKWNGHPREGDITAFFGLWDAGTEVNQEPGLGADQAPRQSGPNTGETEHERVRLVRFVRDGYTYPKTSDVIKVTLSVADPAS